MRKLIFLIFILMIRFNTAYAQVKFQNGFGDLFYETAQGNCVIFTNDSSYVYTGTVFPNQNVAGELMLTKTNLIGTIIWKKLYGCGLNEFGKKVIQTIDGGYLIAGITGVTAGEFNSYIIKTDQNGDTVWTKAYWEPFDDERINDVCETPDSGYLFVGDMLRSSMGPGLYLFKTDYWGNLIWAKLYEGARNAVSVSLLNDGYIISGYSIDSATSGNILIMKIDFNGDSVWTKSFGGTLPEWPDLMSTTSDYGYIITGRTYSFGFGSSDIFLAKTDSLGNLIWAKTYGSANSDYGTSVCQTNDGGYILAGVKKNSLNKALLLKTDSVGNVTGSCTYTNGLSESYANSVKQTIDGGYIMTGKNDDGIFSMIKTDATGNSGCFQQYTTTSSLIAPFVPTISILTKNLFSSIDYGALTVSSPGGTFHSGCLSLNSDLETETLGNFEIFPNPATSEFTINTSYVFLIFELEIYNSFGRILYSGSMENLNPKIDCTNYSPGIYLVKIRTENGISIKKLVVE